MSYAFHTRIELRRFFISFFCAVSAGLSHPPRCWHNKRAEKIKNGFFFLCLRNMSTFVDCLVRTRIASTNYELCTMNYELN